MIKIFEKILSPKGILANEDLTPEQKVRLYDLMVLNGGSKSLAYDRFFKEGFELWEIIGINRIKEEFLKEQGLMPTDGQQPGQFYESLGETRGLKALLRDKMQSLGMKSELTIIRRFQTDNWKPYELRGIKDIIEEFCCGEEEKATA